MFKNHVLENNPEIITSLYGMRIRNGVPAFHFGVDLVGAGHSECNILAYEDGKIILSDKTSSQGNYVRINHGSYITEYLHMKDNSVKVIINQQVVKGQVIGFMGSTGNTTGSHLHFGVLVNGAAVDPMLYLGIEDEVPIVGKTTAVGHGNANELGTGQQTIFDYTGQTMYVIKHVPGLAYPYGLSTSSSGAIVGFWPADRVVIDPIPITPKSVNPYAEPTILVFKGSKGESVKWVQWYLEANKYSLALFGGIDGDFGSGTDKIVKQFQKDKGLLVDGIVGAVTRSALIRGVE